MDANMNKLLGKIANHVNEMIPEEWDKVYIYGEVTEDAGAVAFYYYPKEGEEYIYSANLTDKFNIDENDFNNMEYTLLQYFEQLQKEFKDNGQEVWTNLTMLVDNTGKFKIDYDYTDLSDADDYERQIIWEYKYLGILPSNGRPRDIIDSYIAENNNN